MKKIAGLFACLLLVSNIARAEMLTERTDNALIVKKSSTAEVLEFFREHNYEYEQMDAQIPRIYFLRLPYDWNRTKTNPEKNRAFIRILLPLVLAINEEILQERKKVIKLHGKISSGETLSPEETETVENMAKKYDAYTVMQDGSRAGILLRQLLDKVDIIPPSVMISTAIIYSDWGTSRLAVEENSLYKEEVWYTNQGIKPADDANADYRYKIFTDLADSIRQRALRLNSSIDYDYFRHSRLAQRMSGKYPIGVDIAAMMRHDSKLRNISGIIDYTFSFYKLTFTDLMPQLVNFDDEKGKR